MAAIEIGRAITKSPASVVVVFRDSVTGGVRVRTEDASKPPKWVGGIEIDSARISSLNPEVRRSICLALHEAITSESGLPPKAIALLQSRAKWAEVMEQVESLVEQSAVPAS